MKFSQHALWVFFCHIQYKHNAQVQRARVSPKNLMHGIYMYTTCYQYVATHTPSQQLLHIIW